MDMLSRVMIASLFIVTSAKSLLTAGGFAAFTAVVAKGGLPAPALFAAVALGVKLGAGVALAVGYRTRLAARALVAFLAIATVVYHSSAGELTTALRNVAIAGGLLLLA